MLHLISSKMPQLQTPPLRVIDVIRVILDDLACIVTRLPFSFGIKPGIRPYIMLLDPLKIVGQFMADGAQDRSQCIVLPRAANRSG